MNAYRILLLGLATTVAACASAGGGPSELFAPYLEGGLEPHRSEVDASVARVSAVLPQAYELMGLPLSRNEDLGENTWVTPELQIDGALYQGEANSDYIDCGMTDEGPRADVHPVEFGVLTRLSARTANVTVVETVLVGSAADPAGEVACRGTGKLEGDIARVLRMRAP